MIRARWRCACAGCGCTRIPSGMRPSGGSRRTRWPTRASCVEGRTALDSTPPSLGIDLHGICNVKPPCVYCEWDHAKNLEGDHVDTPFTRDTLHEWGAVLRQRRQPRELLDRRAVHDEAHRRPARRLRRHRQGARDDDERADSHRAQHPEAARPADRPLRLARRRHAGDLCAAAQRHVREDPAQPAAADRGQGRSGEASRASTWSSCPCAATSTSSTRSCSCAPTCAWIAWCCGR